jgi:hypothetical protein
MERLKDLCALGTLGYLVAALLPMQFFPQHVGVIPEWIGRAIFIATSLVFGTIYYGIHTRKPIFWRIIPTLIVIFFLSHLIGGFWTVRPSPPWFPIVFSWFLMMIAGFIILVYGLEVTGQYYYMTRVLHEWAQSIIVLTEGTTALLLGAVTIMTAAAIRKIDKRLNQLEARQQDDK